MKIGALTGAQWKARGQFPILSPWHWKKALEDLDLAEQCPVWVPWNLVAPHETQAKKNHDQSLEELAGRGGLSPDELWCVVRDQRWWPIRMDHAVRWVISQLSPPPPSDDAPPRSPYTV